MLNIPKIVAKTARTLLWKKKINQLLKAIATKADATGWCLYNLTQDEEDGYFVETMIHWYSNARFEMTRYSFRRTEELAQNHEIERDQIICSSIVAEETYLIHRILINLNPDDFSVSYQPSTDEDDEIDAIIEQELAKYLESDDEEDEDDKGEGEQVG